MDVGAGLYMCDVVKKFTFAISSPDELLFHLFSHVSSSLSIPTLAVHLSFTPRISLILPTLDCLLPSDLPSRITGLNTFVFAGGFC